tara:strand:- start:5992 stop:9153 length:3162 start_codon:yes stop_codon:yes gene_type:complete
MNVKNNKTDDFQLVKDFALDLSFICKRYSRGEFGGIESALMVPFIIDLINIGALNDIYSGVEEIKAERAYAEGGSFSFFSNKPNQLKLKKEILHLFKLLKPHIENKCTKHEIIDYKFLIFIYYQHLMSMNDTGWREIKNLTEIYKVAINIIRSNPSAYLKCCELITFDVKSSYSPTLSAGESSWVEKLHAQFLLEFLLGSNIPKNKSIKILFADTNCSDFNFEFINKNIKNIEINSVHAFSNIYLAAIQKLIQINIFRSKKDRTHKATVYTFGEEILKFTDKKRRHEHSSYTINEHFKKRFVNSMLSSKEKSNLKNNEKNSYFGSKNKFDCIIIPTSNTYDGAITLENYPHLLNKLNSGGILIAKVSHFFLDSRRGAKFKDFLIKENYIESVFSLENPNNLNKRKSESVQHFILINKSKKNKNSIHFFKPKILENYKNEPKYWKVWKNNINDEGLEVSVEKVIERNNVLSIYRHQAYLFEGQALKTCLTEIKKDRSVFKNVGPIINVRHLIANSEFTEINLKTLKSKETKNELDPLTIRRKHREEKRSFVLNTKDDDEVLLINNFSTQNLRPTKLNVKNIDYINVSRSISAFRIDKKIINSDYLIYKLNTTGKNQLKLLSTTASWDKFISINNFLEFKLELIPSIEEQIEFNKSLKHSLEKIKLLEKEKDKYLDGYLNNIDLEKAEFVKRDSLEHRISTQVATLCRYNGKFLDLFKKLDNNLMDQIEHTWAKKLKIKEPFLERLKVAHEMTQHINSELKKPMEINEKLDYHSISELLVVLCDFFTSKEIDLLFELEIWLTADDISDPDVQFLTNEIWGKRKGNQIDWLKEQKKRKKQGAKLNRNMSTDSSKNKDFFDTWSEKFLLGLGAEKENTSNNKSSTWDDVLNNGLLIGKKRWSKSNFSYYIDDVYMQKKQLHINLSLFKNIFIKFFENANQHAFGNKKEKKNKVKIGFNILALPQDGWGDVQSFKMYDMEREKYDQKYLEITIQDNGNDFPKDFNKTKFFDKNYTTKTNGGEGGHVIQKYIQHCTGSMIGFNKDLNYFGILIPLRKSY